MKKRIVFGLVLALLLSLAACSGEGDGVSVQRADQLMAAAQAEDRYAGKVVSDNVVEITRDSSKTVEELYVSVGQEVKAGDKLFTYDSDALELELEKTQLEVEKLTNEQTTYAEQLTELEKQLAKTKNQSTIVELTLQINTLKTTQMENDYNIESKQQTIADLQELLSNIEITSPVDGTIRKIDTDGSTSTYITIQQSGAYRVQGTINEVGLSRGTLMAGTRVKVYSRVSDETWMGTVDTIDMENPVTNENSYYYYYSDSMTSTSKYPFYVTLDSTDGLLLGQHVYMEVVAESTDAEDGLWIPEGYILDLTEDEETGEITGKLWVANSGGHLEQRTVTFDMYDGANYEVLSGLEAEDYVADPAASGCKSGASVVYRDASSFGGTADPTGENTQEDSAADGDTVTDGDIPEEDATTETFTIVSEAAAGAEG